MQAIKNGIKTTLRTPGKALLLTLILSVLSALVSLASGGFSAVRGYIKDADGYFHTVAELEFIGENYPSRDKFEQGLPAAIEENEAALAALLSHDAVISFSPASSSAALAEGFKRSDEGAAMPNAAVAALYITGFNEEYLVYNAVVSKIYYSAKDYEGKLVELSVHDGVTGRLESGKKYLMSGYFTSGMSGMSSGRFWASGIDFIAGGEKLTTPDFELVEDADAIKEDDAFMLLASQLERVNNACRVTYTKAVEDELPFHRQQLKLKSGRLFTEEEYKLGAKAVIISNQMAYGAGQKQVGDRIKLSIFDFSGELAAGEFTERDEGEFEIVGIYSDNDAYPNHIFIPGSPGEGIRAAAGSSLGQFRLKNDRAGAFLAEAEKLFEAGFRCSLYDQGYAAATEPMRELALISLVFLAVCVLLAAAALLLQSHIFVSRQRESADTMHSLGASKVHITLYFLSAAMLLALVGAALGIIIARSSEGRAFDIMRRFAEQFKKADMRFSTSRLSLVRTLEFAPRVETKTYLLASGALISGSLVSTLGFALSALKRNRRAAKARAKGAFRTAKTAKTIKAEGRTSRLSGRLKYALLSIMRSPVRTVSVLLLGFVAAAFFSNLTASLEGYERQLEGYKRGAVIRGNATDLNGRNIDGFLFAEPPILNLVQSREIKDINLTHDLGYMSVMDTAITADGAENRDIPYFYPFTEVHSEKLMIRLRSELKWVSTSSISKSPAFRFKSVKDIRFLPGYDESSFMRTQHVCALSESTLKEHGIRLGDAVMFQAMQKDLYGEWETGRIILKVVAAYSSNTTKKTVFTPLYQHYTILDDYRNPTDPDTPFERYEDFLPMPIGEAGSDGESADERIEWRLEAHQSTDFAFEGAKLSEDGEHVIMTINDVETTIPLEEIMKNAVPVKYSSFLFTLKDAGRLDEARDALCEAGYTYVGSGDRTRPYAILEDEAYLNTVRSMQRQIQYVSALYYALYALSGIVGFALAWLLTASRRREMALMLALGTPKNRIILNFFFENALLCALGLALGLGLAVLCFGMQQRLCYMLAAAFFALWSLATLSCLAFALAKKAQAALTEAE